MFKPIYGLHVWVERERERWKNKSGCIAFWFIEATVGVAAGISASPLMISLCASRNKQKSHNEKFSATSDMSHYVTDQMMARRL